LTKAFVT
jgi:Calpain family cysteine protease